MKKVTKLTEDTLFVETRTPLKDALIGDLIRAYYKHIKDIPYSFQPDKQKKWKDRFILLHLQLVARNIPPASLADYFCLAEGYKLNEEKDTD